jgi:hypothetical protein
MRELFLQGYVLSTAGDALSTRKLRDPTPTTAAAMATHYLIATDFFWFYLQFHKTIKLLFLIGPSELEEEIPLYLGRLSVSFIFFVFKSHKRSSTVLEESHRASSSMCWVVS